MLASRKKLTIGFLLALLIPPAGRVPMSAELGSVPTLLIERGEFWAVYAVGITTVYFVFALVIYGLLSTLQWFIARTQRVRRL
jgi:hypothetical protein